MLSHLPPVPWLRSSRPSLVIACWIISTILPTWAHCQEVFWWWSWDGSIGPKIQERFEVIQLENENHRLHRVLSPSLVIMRQNMIFVTIVQWNGKPHSHLPTTPWTTFLTCGECSLFTVLSPTLHQCLHLSVFVSSRAAVQGSIIPDSTAY